MQKDGSHDSGLSASGSPGPPSNHNASSSRFQPSANMRDRLEKLAKWRIDQSSIEFPKQAREFTGGHATVSRAFLALPSGGKDSKKGSDLRKSKSLESIDRAGETSRRLKSVAVKRSKISDDIALVVGLTVREAEFLVGLSHKNIIKLEGFVEDLSKDIVWLVFPWEENGTLRDFIALADWDIPERISLIFDVSSGVEYLHSRQPPICHGDLKSLNVLVNSELRAVITDFGSARRLKTEDLKKETKPAQNKSPASLSLEATFCASTNTITLTGDHYTLRWAAPELLYEEEAGLCSDIWALGWVAYEVMTGFIPFQDVKDTIVIKRVVQGDLPSITGDARMSLIQALCSLMLVCWSIDPSQRPTAEECRTSIGWMPMIVPNHIRNSDTATSSARSPGLLMQLGRMYRHQDDYRSALDCFTKAVADYTNNGNRNGKAAALVQLGKVHELLDESGQAIQFYSEALQICTDIGDRQGRADALWGLAEVHRLRDEYTQAIAFYSEVIEICTDIGNRQGRADALWGLAEVHRLRREYSQAIVFYSEDLQIRTDIGDRHGRSDTLMGLAEVHRLRDEYSQAITFYSEALQIRTDEGNRQGRAEALEGLADVHQARQEYSQAIIFYSEDLKIRTEVGDRLGKAQALRGLAQVHQLRNEFSPAITLLSEALQLSTDLGDRHGKALALSRLADIHRDQEAHGDAVRLYTEAAEVFEQIGNTHDAACNSNQAAKLRQLSNREEAT